MGDPKNGVSPALRDRLLQGLQAHPPGKTSPLSASEDRTTPFCRHDSRIRARRFPYPSCAHASIADRSRLSESAKSGLAYATDLHGRTATAWDLSVRIADD